MRLATSSFCVYVWPESVIQNNDIQVSLFECVARVSAAESSLLSQVSDLWGNWRHSKWRRRCRSMAIVVWSCSDWTLLLGQSWWLVSCEPCESSPRPGKAAVVSILLSKVSLALRWSTGRYSLEDPHAIILVKTDPQTGRSFLVRSTSQYRRVRINNYLWIALNKVYICLGGVDSNLK